MEEILSSIKRIISEEGSAPSAPRSRRAARPTPSREEGEDGARDLEEVLELRDAVETAREDEPVLREDSEAAAPKAQRPAPRAENPEAAPSEAEQVEALRNAESIISDRAAEASRGKLEALSRMVVKPQVPGSDTLEGMVREMLRPMLSDWLDDNLPRIVEELVSKEITRITGRNG
ncbi:DUF2497 domain-containing protein [Sphingosinithalassobacter tenebrarum]|uniref:DUF2497 domain-containing protein n=2 Tax=Stakelama tenebrarum TaxID=2711215 RepID=A0A6G6YB54_9SPHN|nr:DUF2497 domain-containing protein [Sphingosinithalassobacter tenebrarum]